MQTWSPILHIGQAYCVLQLCYVVLELIYYFIYGFSILLDKHQITRKDSILPLESYFDSIGPENIPFQILT